MVYTYLKVHWNIYVCVWFYLHRIFFLILSIFALGHRNTFNSHLFFLSPLSLHSASQLLLLLRSHIFGHSQKFSMPTLNIFIAQQQKISLVVFLISFLASFFFFFLLFPFPLLKSVIVVRNSVRASNSQSLFYRRTFLGSFSNYLLVFARYFFTSPTHKHTSNFFN